MNPLKCKVFCATKARDRLYLGDAVTHFLRDGQVGEVVSAEVLQSSDAAYHCISIVLWYR